MDDDDLDELLDEVEKKFCRTVSVCSSARTESNEDRKYHKHSATKQNRKINSGTEDVDSFLEELLDEDYSDSTSSKTDQFPKGDEMVKKRSTQSGGRKSCDQLRCTSCDFRVLTFDDCEWDLSCDYLFLRNNMPDCQKLRSKLKKRRAFRSYCCQCSWVSTSEVTDLRERPLLRWVCGKHHD